MGERLSPSLCRLNGIVYGTEVALGMRLSGCLFLKLICAVPVKTKTMVKKSLEVKIKREKK